jgi:hypothetical protein
MKYLEKYDFKKKRSLARWHVPVVLATWEAKVGVSFEPLSLRPL